MVRRKCMICCIMAVAFMAIVTGCNSKKEDNKMESTPTTEVQEDIEPSQSKEAKKLLQFKEPKEGDLVAEITVKDFGTMKLKLFPDQAPKAVENFVTHAKAGYYDGVTFHRILDDFMIQGGDPLGTGSGGESIWGKPFEDEFTNDLYPYRGALCMANAGENTNGSQFFIVQANEEEVVTLQELVLKRYKMSLIDYCEQGYEVSLTEKEMKGFLTYGGTPWLTQHHTVFGQLVEGFDVLDAIAKTPIANEGGTPVEAVIIEGISIIEYKK